MPDLKEGMQGDLGEAIAQNTGRTDADNSRTISIGAEVEGICISGHAGEAMQCRRWDACLAQLGLCYFFVISTAIGTMTHAQQTCVPSDAGNALPKAIP